MVSNVITLETVVDYDDVYYYNVNIPLFGTANATMKLAGDGTLTEATTNVDTTKLAEEIPLSEFLTKKLKLEPKMETSTAFTASTVRVPPRFAKCKAQGAPEGERRLTIERKQAGYVYTLSRLCGPDKDKAASGQGHDAAGTDQSTAGIGTGNTNVAQTSCDQPITFPIGKGVSITRTVLGEGDKKEEKKKDPNTATFTGSLVLPEAKGK